jgi:hypothetical protein
MPLLNFVNNGVWPGLWILLNVCLLCAIPIYGAVKTDMGFKILLYGIGALGAIVLASFYLFSIPTYFSIIISSMFAIAVELLMVEIGPQGTISFELLTVVLYSFGILSVGCYYCLILGLSMYAISPDLQERKKKYVQVILNSLVAIVVVGGYVLFYNEAETCKPGWLEYIGM